jgi:hypothetical protein
MIKTMMQHAFWVWGLMRTTENIGGDNEPGFNKAGGFVG